MAKQGAGVTGVDIGPRLIEAADRLAGFNDVDGRFARVNTKALPFAAESFDVDVALASDITYPIATSRSGAG